MVLQKQRGRINTVTRSIPVLIDARKGESGIPAAFMPPIQPPPLVRVFEDSDLKHVMQVLQEDEKARLLSVLWLLDALRKKQPRALKQAVIDIKESLAQRRKSVQSPGLDQADRKNVESLHRGLSALYGLGPGHEQEAKGIWDGVALSPREEMDVRSLLSRQISNELHGVQFCLVVDRQIFHTSLVLPVSSICTVRAGIAQDPRKDQGVRCLSSLWKSLYPRTHRPTILLDCPSRSAPGCSLACSREAGQEISQTIRKQGGRQMALFKRNKTWWTDFSVNGQRFRLSLETTDWREANNREKDKIGEAREGKLSTASRSFARLAFTKAAERYLSNRKLELSDRSLKKERQLLVRPSCFFGATPLTRITAEDLLAYRESRAKDNVGPAYLNMEMGAIRRILKRAKRWHLVAEDIRPLKERHEIGRALAHEEKVRLLRIAAMCPEWRVTRCAAIVALNTTMRGCELKSLRWRDVNLIDRMLTVRFSKTQAGERVIPLNADAMAAIIELYKRAQAASATDLNHHVFPACENDRIDPTRPQTTWRTAWRRLDALSPLSTRVGPAYRVPPTNAATRSAWRIFET